MEKHKIRGKNTKSMKKLKIHGKNTKSMKKHKLHENTMNIFEKALENLETQKI